MPELPEVETTRRGIAPHLLGRTVSAVAVHERRLRRPVPAHLETTLTGLTLEAVERRGKYLRLCFPPGELILHLGMSGSLRILPAHTPPARHDHLDLVFHDRLLRLHDPRRFGLVDWQAAGAVHPWLAHLGPEPLGEDFHGDYLARLAQGRRTAVKTFLMNARVVVGVGNIYASEALFRAGVHPARAAGRIARKRWTAVAEAVRAVLAEAIRQGGTTLRDFTRADGRPGYFAQSLSVYGHAGEPCPRCHTPIQRRIIGGRASYFCPACQR